MARNKVCRVCQETGRSKAGIVKKAAAAQGMSAGSKDCSGTPLFCVHHETPRHSFHQRTCYRNVDPTMQALGGVGAVVSIAVGTLYFLKKGPFDHKVGTETIYNEEPNSETVGAMADAARGQGLSEHQVVTMIAGETSLVAHIAI